ncbi:MAG TPA: SH3 domain-containing protein [Anaerolineales bacterium]|nr:SH3 domain-containing protein [Anaerolineales bacterium]
MTSTVAPFATVAVETPTTAPSATVPPTVGPPPEVKVQASGGRLNVRRGPGPEYDSVGAFLDGQSSIATARNSDGTWVLINVPNTSKPLGWITLATKYTSTSGETNGLPLLEVAPAAPAYIRNCTGREMLVNPTGAVLQPRSNAPDNQLQFFPGEYSIVDMETETAISDLTVFEGKTIDIKQDSSGKKFSC